MYSIADPLKLSPRELQLLEDLEEVLQTLSNLQASLAGTQHTDQLQAIQARLTDIIASEFYGLARGSCPQPVSHTPPSAPNSSCG